MATLNLAILKQACLLDFSSEAEEIKKAVSKFAFETVSFFINFHILFCQIKTVIITYFNKPLILAAYQVNSVNKDDKSGKLECDVLHLPDLRVFETNLKSF